MMHYMFSLLMLFLFVSAIMGCSHITGSKVFRGSTAGSGQS